MSKLGSRIAVFFISLTVWLLITSFTDLQEIVVGIIVALLVALLNGDLLTPHKIKFGFKAIYHLIVYFLILVREIIKANIHVASIVLHPKLPIRPGIVKIKTGLNSDTALTVLANSITLTPGTLTVDIDKTNGFLYIHCLQVPGRDIESNTKAIGWKYEKRLREIFK